jgi:hypothetical protein
MHVCALSSHQLPAAQSESTSHPVHVPVVVLQAGVAPVH